MGWKATGPPTVRKHRDKWAVRIDGIDTATGKARPRQLASFGAHLHPNAPLPFGASRGVTFGDVAAPHRLHYFDGDTITFAANAVKSAVLA